MLKVQLETKLARHPELLAKVLQQAIAEAPEVTMEAPVETQKEEPKVEVK